MKVLLDTCVAGALVSPALTEAGHDVVWAGDWDSDPGDEAILAHAHREGRVLVTLDKDFGGWPSSKASRTAVSSAWSIWLLETKQRFVCWFWMSIARN